MGLSKASEKTPPNMIRSNTSIRRYLGGCSEFARREHSDQALDGFLNSSDAPALPVSRFRMVPRIQTIWELTMALFRPCPLAKGWRLFARTQLDSIPFSGYHILIIAVLALVGFIEGYDLVITGSLWCWPRCRCT